MQNGESRNYNYFKNTNSYYQNQVGIGILDTMTFGFQEVLDLDLNVYMQEKLAIDGILYRQEGACDEKFK